MDESRNEIRNGDDALRSYFLDLSEIVKEGAYAPHFLSDEKVDILAKILTALR